MALRVFTVNLLVALLLLFASMTQTLRAGELPFNALESSKDGGLTLELSQVARIIGVLPIMQQITLMQSELKGTTQNQSLEFIAKRQKLLYLRQKQTQILNTANLEVNATRSRIETEMAQVQHAQAAMVEKRARVLRRNTIINFISGGLTKIAGYSIALGGPDTPTNILEVFDGSVQCGLSGTTMKELHSENRVAGELPPLLAALNDSKDSGTVYPEQIWQYLNEPAKTGSGAVSRREQLSSTWQDRGMLARSDQAVRWKAGNAGHHLALARITPQLLEDRLAMLAELRSVVSEMHNSLMRISQICKTSFENDPSFEWPLASSGNSNDM